MLMPTQLQVAEKALTPTKCGAKDLNAISVLFSSVGNSNSPYSSHKFSKFTRCGCGMPDEDSFQIKQRPIPAEVPESEQTRYQKAASYSPNFDRIENFVALLT